MPAALSSSARLLAVGGAGRMDHQRFGVADVGQMRGELDRLDELSRRRMSAFYAESQNRPAAARQIFLRHFIIRMRGQARIVHPSHQRMRFQKFRHGQGVFAMPRHAQMKRFQSLQEQKRIERAEHAAHVAQPVRPAGDDVAQLADGLVKNRAVVGRIGLGELRPFFRLLRPVESAAVDNRPADARAVPADKLRQAVYGNVDAVIERLKKHRREHRVVAHHRQAMLVGHIGNGLVVEHVVLRIGQRFDIHRPGVGPNGSGNFLGIFGIDESHVDTQSLEGLRKQRDCAAVKRRRGNDVPAGMHQIPQCNGDRLLPAG